MNNVVYFEIQSSNPTREVAFYSKVFSWKFVKQEGLPIEYYRIETEGIPGALLKRPSLVPPPAHGTNAFTCSIEVLDFDTTANIIIENGGQVALPKFAVPGKCWQGYFIDMDNNVFGIFQIDSLAAIG